MRRWLLRAVVVLAVVLVAATVVVHLRPVQRMVWDRAVRVLGERTGWAVRAGAVRFRLWPARLELRDVEAGPAGGGTAVAARTVRASWRWYRLLGRRHRLDGLAVDGLAVDGAVVSEAVRSGRGEGGGTARVAFGIGRFEVRGGGSGPAGPVTVTVRDLVASGSLGGGTLRLALRGRPFAGRDGRTLGLGVLDIAASASASGVVVERLALDGGPLAVRGKGRLSKEVGAAAAGRLELHGRVRPAPLVAFWDQAVAARAAVRGTLRFDGEAGLVDGAPAFRLEGVGEGLAVASLDVDRLTAKLAGGTLRAAVSAGQWGRIGLDGPVTGPYRGEARLEGVPVAALVRAHLPGGVVIPPEAVLGGTVRFQIGGAAAGFEPRGGEAELELAWTGGRAAAEAALESGTLRLREGRLEIPGASARVSGWAGHRLDLTVSADVSDVAAAMGEIRRWGLPVPAVEPPGGRYSLRGTLTGTAAAPEVDLELDAEEPRWHGVGVPWLSACLRGPARSPEIAGSAGLPGGGTVAVEGAADAGLRALAVRWEVTVPDVASLLDGFGVGGMVSGSLRAAGTAAYGGGAWRAGGTARLTDGRLGGVPVRTATLEVSADPSGIGLRRLAVESSAGRVEATGTVGGLDPGAPLDFWLRVSDVRPERFPGGPWTALHGSASLMAGLGGTAGNPRLRGRLIWRPDQAGELIGAFEAGLEAGDGLVRLAAPRVGTAAGPLSLFVSLPVGGLPRPAWLWPGAPGGTVRIRLSGCSLESGPILRALGRPPLGASVRGDLEADVDLDARTFEPAAGLVTVRNLVIETPYAGMRAAGDMTLRLDGDRVVLEPLHLTGEAGELEVEGSAVPATRRIALEARGSFGEPMLRLLLPSARIQGGVTVDAHLEGTLPDLSGTVELDQGSGRIVLTDPPVEIRRAHAVLELRNGLLEVPDGSLLVNGGHVELGGGWDPESGQGIVAELENVAAIVPPGIVTHWNGLLSFGPGMDGRTLLEGDLELADGIWDSPFDLLRLASAGVPLQPAIGDPLERIDLEVEVTGRNGILVENNLGTFQLAWKRLDVGGTLARPSIEGTLQLVPGGRLHLRGRTLSVVRGRIELPGETGGEPEVSLVVRDTLSVAAGLETLDLADVVQAGAAASMGRLFGFESTAIDPVEVAAETETDPARRLTLGRRFGRHVSYFFSTNLADTQDTTQIVQVGNLGIPGLYGQWITSSTESDGWAVLERMQWGGTPPEDGGRERLRKVRFEGDWPLSLWVLRARLGLFPGQRWEPFMAFSSRVRLERELAGAGYPSARVTVAVSGSPEKRVLTFACDPGERIEVRWEGDKPDGATRRNVVALWTPALPAHVSLEAMREAVQRWFAENGYPNARVETARSGDEIVIRSEKGERLELEGLEVEGIGPGPAEEIARWWRSPGDLAALLAGREAARARLEETFRAEGFGGVRIASIGLQRTGKHAGVVRVVAVPGLPLTVGSIELEGRDPLGVVRSTGFALKVGVPLRRSILASARRELLARYREAGYLDVRVRLRQHPSDSGGTVVVQLEPGIRSIVGDVRFEGLRHVHEKVLREGLLLEPGEPLREEQLDASLDRIGVFPPVKSVKARLEPGEGGKTGVVLDVRERPRWTVGTGLRWSSDRGSQLLLELDDEDLFGRGLSARFRVRWGSRDRLGQLLLGLPPVPGGRFHFAFSSTFTQTERGYRVERAGLFSLEGWIERGIGEEIRLYLQRQRTHLYEKDPNPFFPLDLTITSASIGGQVILERRDNLFDPRHGWFLSVDGSYSGGLLGSDLKAIRSMVSFSLATEPRKGWTYAQGIRVGFAHALEGVLDPTHRFYTGGERSIRGFERDWVGPVVCIAGRCAPTGGGALVVLNQELRFPIAGTLRGAVFADVGQVWERWSDANFDLSVGTGIGLRWGTPLGPLRLDLAIPVAHKGISSGLTIYFGIGQVF